MIQLLHICHVLAPKDKIFQGNQNPPHRVQEVESDYENEDPMDMPIPDSMEAIEESSALCSLQTMSTTPSCPIGQSQSIGTI